MSIADYVKRAEECERLAAECQTDSNREIFLDIAAKWRSMAADAAAAAAPLGKTVEGSDLLKDAGGGDGRAQSSNRE